MRHHERKHGREIVQTADTCAGSWRVNRRRIRVVDILRMLTCPEGYALVREGYPDLSDKQIEAALIFAQEHIDNDRIEHSCHGTIEARPPIEEMQKQGMRPGQFDALCRYAISVERRLEAVLRERGENPPPTGIRRITCEVGGIAHRHVEEGKVTELECPDEVRRQRYEAFDAAVEVANNVSNLGSENLTPQQARMEMQYRICEALRALKKGTL